MKSKAWINRLLTLLAVIPFAEDDVPPTSDEQRQMWLRNQIKDLQDECLDIVKMRMHLNEIGELTNIVFIHTAAAAFREAAVKWDSILHGLKLRTEELPFPLIKGGFFMPVIEAFYIQLTNTEITAHSRARLDTLEALGKQIGLEHPEADGVYAMCRAIFVDYDSKIVKGHRDGVRELRQLRQKKVNGYKGGNYQGRLDALERWVARNTATFNQALLSLPSGLQTKFAEEVATNLVPPTKQEHKANGKKPQHGKSGNKQHNKGGKSKFDRKADEAEDTAKLQAINEQLDSGVKATAVAENADHPHVTTAPVAVVEQSEQAAA